MRKHTEGVSTKLTRDVIIAGVQAGCQSRKKRGQPCTRALLGAFKFGGVLLGRQIVSHTVGDANTQTADTEVTPGTKGCTASRNPIALRMADKLLSAGLPFGESVR